MAKALGLPGMAGGHSEATETIKGETAPTPTLSETRVILPAATSDWFVIRTLPREPKLEGLERCHHPDVTSGTESGLQLPSEKLNAFMMLEV